MNYNCLFCNKENKEDTYELSFCTNHKTVVAHSFMSDLNIVFFSIILKDKEYVLYFYPKDNIFLILQGLKEIIRWNFIPNITPDNAEEKLKLLLPFL